MDSKWTLGTDDDEPSVSNSGHVIPGSVESAWVLDKSVG